MGWTHVPNIDSGAKTSDDNPFAGPKLQTPGKVSVNIPTDEWLCNKLSKLNLTLVQGYPSRTTEAGVKGNPPPLKILPPPPHLLKKNLY